MIGIIAAMPEEVSAIVSTLSNVEHREIAHLDFTRGTITTNDVCVMRSGVGKGNAAMSTTILLEHFPIKEVINIGTAGGLRKEQEVLDVIIANRVVQYDYDTSALDKEAGKGRYYNPSSTFIQKGIKALESINVAHHIGLVASGDTFISEPLQFTNLLKKFPDAICAEMEAGAIAQVCNHYQIPFAILRALSDIAFKELSPLDFKTYVNAASKQSAMVCKQMIMT